MRPTRTSTADYIRAIARLDPDGATAARIAALLGLDPLQPRFEPAEAPPLTEPASGATQALTTTSPSGPTSPSAEVGLPVLVHHLPRVEPVAPAWAHEDAVGRLETESDPWPHIDAPLLTDPTTLIDALRRAFSTWRERREPDIDRLVQVAARRTPLVRIPWKRVRALQPAITVFVDLRLAMTPFSADQTSFVGLLESLFGTSRIAVVLHHGAPAPDDAPTATHGVALSDLGFLEQPSDPTELRRWSTLAQALQRRGGWVVAFNPCRKARWAGSIPFPTVEWSERTEAKELKEHV